MTSITANTARSSPLAHSASQQASAVAGTLCIAALLAGWTWSITVPARVDALPYVMVEIAAMATAIIALIVRDPLGTLRLSNPALSICGWMYFYFIQPAVTWLQGNRMVFEASSTVVLDVTIVSEVQVLQTYFIVAFFVAYLLISPRAVIRPLVTGQSDVRVNVLPFVLLGLAPYLATSIDRIVATGTILPTSNYGDFVARDFDELNASRTIGGANLLLQQIYSKVWYFTLMALGLGYGITLARLVIRRRWTSIALLFGHAPLLLLLSAGSRSFTAYPYLMALMLADAIAGPYAWWYFAPFMVLVYRAFNFYGIYRAHQHRGFGEALSNSTAELDRPMEFVDTEDAAMLTKTAYCVHTVNHGRDHQGLEYFYNQLIQLLPSQIAPEKLRIANTAEFLSSEFIGYRRQGSGVAGTIVGDGYLMSGDLGVIVLGALLGAMLALIVRWGMTSEHGRPVLWRYTLMLLYAVQTTQYIRADLGAVCVQILYYLVLPTLLLRLLIDTKVARLASWTKPLDTY
jgi:hypothetical protein